MYFSVMFQRKKIEIEEGDYYLTPEGYRCLPSNTTSNVAIAAKRLPSLPLRIQ